MSKRCIRTAVLAGLALSTLTLSTLAVAGPARAESAGAGKGLYNTYCIICHGPNMVNTGDRAFDLRKFPLNDKARFIHSVTKGKNQMPAWGDVLEPAQINDLWAYVKTRGH